MKCQQCGAGVTGNFCAYCNTSTDHSNNTSSTASPYTEKYSESGTETMHTDQNAKLIEGYKQQIQKVSKMKIPENIKQVKINVIQKKIDSLSS